MRSCSSGFPSIAGGFFEWLRHSLPPGIARLHAWRTTGRGTPESGRITLGWPRYVRWLELGQPPVLLIPAGTILRVQRGGSSLVLWAPLLPPIEHRWAKLAGLAPDPDLLLPA